MSVGTEHHLVEASPWAVHWAAFTAEHIRLQSQQQRSSQRPDEVNVGEGSPCFQ